MTDFEGKPLDWSHGKKLTHNKVHAAVVPLFHNSWLMAIFGQYVVATNGKLHSTVLAAIRSVLQETPLE